MNTRLTLPRSLISAVSEFVAAGLGLHFPEERWTDLERGIAGTARDLGQRDTETCARWLLSAPLTREQTETLARHLTVGETYFFREQETLQVFERQIVPDLLRARHSGARRLRIWSAGCCSGEEPYSIAMILDGLIPESQGWDVTVLATDINPQFLRKAGKGVYSDWSFRGTSARIRERYFRRTGDGRFELLPRIRSRVSFAYLNLATDAYPSLLNNTDAMDVIFCRNVLMYFSKERTSEVTRNFHRALVPDGWLIVSAAETSITLASSFSVVQLPGALVYRKAGDEKSEDRVIEPLAATDAIANVFPGKTPSPLVEAMTAETFPIALRSEGAHGSGGAPTLSATARRFANEGRLADAIEWCEKAIAADKMNAAHHFLLATVRQEQGLAEQAVQSLTRTLYLDPDFALAHFGLANVELSRGRRESARRHFANALETLRTHAQDEILPESDGLTTGRLAEIITSVMDGLPPGRDDHATRTMRHD